MNNLCLATGRKGNCFYENMGTLIEIDYRNLPQGIFHHLENSIIKGNSHFTIRKSNDNISNFTGGPPDTIITINLFLLGFLTNSFIYPAFYDLFKTSILFLWKKIVGHYSIKKTPLEDDKNYISLQFKIFQNKVIEFNLEGNIPKEKILPVTENIFNYLKDQTKLNHDIENLSFQSDNDSTIILSLEIDHTTFGWKPIDFEERKKRMNEYLTNMLDELES